jgi:SAM-dependent methyltransferase
LPSGRASRARACCDRTRCIPTAAAATRSSTRACPADAAGGAFYDAGDSFDRYREAAAPGPESANHVMEEPAVTEALGDPRGLRVVELGCGDGAFGRRLLDAGCASYLGIDGSDRMVAAARVALAGTAGEIRQEPIEGMTLTPAAFDLVVSRMALHYVADLDAALAACHACLAPAGRILLTVTHPVITSHDARPDTEQRRGNWVVDDYFTPGPREQRWLGGRVLWHHRTVEDHVASLIRAGFELTRLSECPPRPERFGDDAAELARRRRIPLFLLLAAARR